MQKKTIILFDDEFRQNLLPLNFCCPIASLTIGFLSIKQKWKLICENQISVLTPDYLQKKFVCEYGESNIYVNSALLPTREIWQHIEGLEEDTTLTFNNKIIAFKSNEKLEWNKLKFPNNKIRLENADLIESAADVFSKNGKQILNDLKLIDLLNYEIGGQEEKNTYISSNQIYVHPTANVTGAIINATQGPVVIHENAVIMEGAMLRGPLAICKNAVVKMGSKIYGSTTIGESCKVGGEISNVVFQGFSNKAHDGYLGNSVIGRWCNLGADTNCSNLKNNYGHIKTWNYSEETFKNTGLMFHGLILGDHSKCSINTMFNTGTTVGVFANIFSDGFPPKFIPSFSWGNIAEYNFEKAMEVAKQVMERRNIKLYGEDILLLKHIFKITQSYRNKYLQ